MATVADRKNFLHAFLSEMQTMQHVWSAINCNAISFQRKYSLFIGIRK